MIDCAILGDSLAVGVGISQPQCHINARVGITSQKFLIQYPTIMQANKTLISLGSNDGVARYTEDSMRLVRNKITTGEVTWLLSTNNQRAHDIAKKIAREFGDRIIESAPHISRDGVHPTSTGYYNISRQWMGTR
jgi:lysophospholipase L1-like esterase